MNNRKLTETKHNKIAGFLICKSEERPEFDIFQAGLSYKLIHYSDYFVHIWGIGNLEACKTKKGYSLSFPLNDELSNRNVLINLNKKELTVENDWLNSIPVFYNEKNKIISTLFNLCLKNKEINIEGLADYCDCGYSAYGNTVFKDIQFMRHYSEISLKSHGLEYTEKKDIFLEPKNYEKKTTSAEIVEYTQKDLANLEKSTSGDIILPLSGGYDSRFIVCNMQDKSRIKNFTYGISKRESDSHEVIIASKVAAALGTQWQQVELRGYLNFIKEWNELYGASIHLHGMYHIEFYKKILSMSNLKNPIMISGACGDTLSGNLMTDGVINNEEDLSLIHYSHGISVSRKYQNFKSDYKLGKQYFKKHQYQLNLQSLRPIFVIRSKLILLSYLYTVPEYLGIPVYAPFLNYESCMRILSLPLEERRDRKWQKDFFISKGINFESDKLNTSNRQDDEAVKQANLEPINVDLMKGFFDTKRMREINYILSTPLLVRIQNNIFHNKYFHKLRIKRVIELLGLSRMLGFDKNRLVSAFHNYIIIKAVELAIKDQNT